MLAEAGSWRIFRE